MVKFGRRNQKIKYIKIITYGNFPYGGASANYLRHFAKGLAGLDYDIEVLLPTGQCYGNNIEKVENRLSNCENVKYKFLGYKNHPNDIPRKIIDLIGGSLNTLFYLLKSVINNNADILIKYNTSVTSNISYLLLSWLFHIKVIYILPEFYEKPTKKSSWLEFFKWYNFYYGLRYFTKKANGLIVMSFYLRNYFTTFLSYKKPVIVIPNLTAPELFESNYKRPFKKGYYTIGYVGTPTKKDGILDLLTGFSIFNNKYPNSHLLIIGDITNGKSIISNLKTFSRELGILKNITFTGLVPYKKIPNLLNSCNALVLARPKGIFAEAGFPTKLGEYFACKKPVVITKVGDIPKYFEDKKHAVLVNPNDPNDISKGFEFLINNESKSKKIALNGYEWMMENLYYKKIAFKISDFIRCIYES